MGLLLHCSYWASTVHSSNQIYCNLILNNCSDVHLYLLLGLICWTKIVNPNLCSLADPYKLILNLGIQERDTFVHVLVVYKLAC
jgi:hypothetical protein